MQRALPPFQQLKKSIRITETMAHQKVGTYVLKKSFAERSFPLVKSCQQVANNDAALDDTLHLKSHKETDVIFVVDVLT